MISTTWRGREEMLIAVGRPSWDCPALVFSQVWLLKYGTEEAERKYVEVSGMRLSCLLELPSGSRTAAARRVVSLSASALAMSVILLL